VIDELVDLVVDRRDAADAVHQRPFVVGIAGGVGVGKTTLAASLSAALARIDLSVVVVATDNFLFPNDELARRGLLMQKGFPQTYDVDAIESVIATLRRGATATVPVYDHQTYDVVDVRTDVDPTDVLVLEGVNVLQERVADLLDVSIYLDVDVDHARSWFFDRFRDLCEKGEGFYAPFKTMTDAERASIAESAWSGINLVNLEQHIAPTMRRADVVVAKDAVHTIVSITLT
jgi:type I pantothenate kinase